MLVSISEGFAREGLLGAILFSELDILAAVELVGLAEERGSKFVADVKMRVHGRH
jgi:hypothetical protein